MATPADLVAETFANAQTLANETRTQSSQFINALTGAVTVAPTVDVTWQAVEAPTAAVAPTRPAALEALETAFDFDTTINAAKPSALAVAAPTVTIDTFTEVAPTVTFPDAPVLSIGAAPTVPDVAAITVPDAPTIALPTAPTFLALATPTFAGLDLHASLQTPLETMPTLTLAAPTAYTYTAGPQYSSALLTALQSTLAARLAGGTGLSEAVEQAIWDRARDREAAAWQASLDAAGTQSEALGYALPPGVVAEQVRQATRELHDKTAGLSRDVAIEQAKLEQANAQQTIATVLDLEGRLIAYSFQLEQKAFEHARYLADNAIQIYNAQVSKFQTVLQAYTAYSAGVQTILEAEKLKIAKLQADIALEQAKADSNRNLIEQYKVDLEARMIQLRVFEAQIQAAKAQMELEGAKVAAAGERIRAYVAGINGETAKVEAYKAGVQAEAEKVQVYKIKADAFSSRVNGQAEAAKANLAYYEALQRSKAAEWEAWRSRVTAEGERIRAVGMKSQSVLDGFRADTELYRAKIDQDMKHWEASMKQYEAQRNYTLAAEKINADVIHANNQSLLEAGKVGAQVFAQLNAAAISVIRASASVSAGAQMQVGYSYSNSTQTAPASVTAV